MNRIILVGNGFDLAHDLKTKYTDFIDDFWEQKTDSFKKLYREGKFICSNHGSNPQYGYSDEDIGITNSDPGYNPNKPFDTILGQSGYNKFSHFYSQLPFIKERNIIFINQFLEQITNKKSLENWVDIEEEYYVAVNNCLNENDDHYHAVNDFSEEKREGGIENLNKEFSRIKIALEEYLSRQAKICLNKLPLIERNIYSPLLREEIPCLSNDEKILNILFLSFNYTATEKLYVQNADPPHTIIHIHGELNNPDNPIVFGYGDEIDEKYKLIENKNDNKYLENIKSFKYFETRNYKNLLSFINFSKYQIFIMGHSCGISDRTLLNTLFEHENCISIKVFYHKRADNTDNYDEVVKNISRNFRDKYLMRKIVVNKKDSVSLS